MPNGIRWSTKTPLSLVCGGFFLVVIIACCGGLLPDSGTPEPDRFEAVAPESIDHSPLLGDRAPELLPEPEEQSEPTPSVELEASPPLAEPLVAVDAPVARLLLPEPVKRTWTAANGTSSVVATLVDHKDGYVLLERADTGARVSLAVAKLSDEDQTHVTYATTRRYDQDAKILVGKVSRILDGDTVKIHDLATGQVNVRLDGIDSPEIDQRFGKEARIWLTKEVANQVVRAEVTGKDRYGRTLANVYIGDRWLNRELVSAGLAWHYTQYNSDARLAKAQHEARTKVAGLWQDARKVAPWDYRNGVRIETAKPVDAPSIRETDRTVYVTNSGSKYHRAGCRYLSKSKIAIPLSRATSAYEPCKVCRPPTK